jgi:hypothetical protein
MKNTGNQFSANLISMPIEGKRDGCGSGNDCGSDRNIIAAASFLICEVYFFILLYYY